MDILNSGYLFTFDRYLNCFQFLATMNNTAIDIHMCMFLHEHMFSFGNIHRSGIAGSYGNSMYKIFKELPKCSKVSVPF